MDCEVSSDLITHHRGQSMMSLRRRAGDLPRSRRAFGRGDRIAGDLTDLAGGACGYVTGEITLFRRRPLVQDLAITLRCLSSRSPGVG